MKKIFTLFAVVLMATKAFAAITGATELLPGVPTQTEEEEFYYFTTTGAGTVTFECDATGQVEYDLYNEAGQYQGVDLILTMLNSHRTTWSCPAAGTYYWQQFSSGTTNLTVTGDILVTPTSVAALSAEKVAKTTKRVENGMIVIERNGVKYSVLGTVIK